MGKTTQFVKKEEASGFPMAAWEGVDAYASSFCTEGRCGTGCKRFCDL